MTRVEFHHDAADKVGVACRLASEFYRAGRQVVVYAPEAAVAQRFDLALWTNAALDFVPHVSSNNPHAAQTPIVICQDLGHTPHDDILVNLDGDLPPGFARFRQLIEIVGRSEEDKLPARKRYMFYRERGYDLGSVSHANSHANTHNNT